MIALASKLDLLTTPYVFTPEQAQEMAKAGADLLVAHAGLTTQGSSHSHDIGSGGRICWAYR